jgi:DNA-directed RNA polymerase subunit omega
MARVTVEDCLVNIPNRFSLVHLAARRTKQLLKGSDPLVRSRNKEAVTALREIAAGKVSFEELSRIAKEAESELTSFNYVDETKAEEQEINTDIYTINLDEDGLD